MPELLSLCFSEVLRALLTWVPILVGSVVLLGIALFALCRHRFRRLAAAQPGSVSSARAWSAYGLLILTQVVVLPLVALVAGIPFALQQGAADAIDSASPRILDWGVRTGTDALKEKLSVGDDTTIVDLGKIAPVLRRVAPVAARARGFLTSLSVVPRLAGDTYFRAANLAVEEAAATNLRVTWDDLSRSARRHFGVLWAGQTRIVASFLRGSALHFLQFLAVTAAIVDLACLLAIFALTQPGGGPAR
jgi:hypothetical protein